MQAKLIDKDNGRVVNPEEIVENVDKLSFLEISNRLCKFMKAGKLDRDTEELLLSRVSVKVIDITNEKLLKIGTQKLYSK